MGFGGEDGDGGERSDDGDDDADAREFPESDFHAARGELDDDEVGDGADRGGVAGERAGAGDGEPNEMRVGERIHERTHEKNCGDVAHEIAEGEHGAADGEKLRSDAVLESRGEEANDVACGAGIFEALHDDKQRSEEEQQFPIEAAQNRFGFHASDEQNECADGSSGERKRKIHDPQNEDEKRGERAFDEQNAVEFHGG